MTDQAARTEHFLTLHHGPEPLLLPNAWDRGSAVLPTSLGFAAIATTSSGFAATLGRLQGTHGYLTYARIGRDAVQAAFSR